MRRSGKTTRTVDGAIQELFTRGWIRIPLRPSEGFNPDEVIEDPSAIELPMSYSIIQRDLFQRVIRRLESEHYGQYEVNKSAGRIKLKGN